MMKYKSNWIVFSSLLALALLIAPTANAATHTLKATGEESTPNGDGLNIDDHWTVALIPGTPPIGNDNALTLTTPAVLKPLVQALVPSDFKEAWVLPADHWPLGQNPVVWPAGNWIVPLNDQTTPDPYGLSHIPGYYAYKLTFDLLTGGEALDFSHLIATDNEVMSAYLNGVDLLVSDEGGPNFTPKWKVETDPMESYPLFAGVNELIIVVSNHGNPENYGNPTGIMVGPLQLTDDNVVPEPATLLIFGGLGTVLAGRRLMRRK